MAGEQRLARPKVKNGMRSFAVLLLGMAAMDVPVQTLAHELPLIIGHRGASHAAPENTLAAFRLAWQEGADGIEGDFHLSADGHIVCIHDSDTRRTTGQVLQVAEVRWEQLAKLDAGSWKSPRFADQTLPQLADVLATLPSAHEHAPSPVRGKIYIEVKCGAEIVPALKQTLEQSGIQMERVAVISFDEEVIAATKRVLPQVTANWLTDFKEQPDGSWLPTPATIVATLTRLGADGVGVGARRGALTPQLAQALHQGHFGFHVWTVDDADLARHLIELGVDSLTTNRPGELRKALQSKQEFTQPKR